MTDGSIQIPSPCVRRCALDAYRCCTGCGRTIDEIMRWRDMSAAERDVVLARLAAQAQTQAPRAG